MLQQISLNFTTFNVEPHDRCGYDSVNVFDTDDTNSLGVLCGTDIPDSIKTTTNTMLIVFTTDDYDGNPVNTGFTAHLSFVNDDDDDDDDDSKFLLYFMLHD